MVVNTVLCAILIGFPFAVAFFALCAVSNGQRVPVAIASPRRMRGRWIHGARWAITVAAIVGPLAGFWIAVVATHHVTVIDEVGGELRTSRRIYLGEVERSHPVVPELATAPRDDAMWFINRTDRPVRLEAVGAYGQTAVTLAPGESAPLDNGGLFPSSRPAISWAR